MLGRLGEGMSYYLRMKSGETKKLKSSLLIEAYVDELVRRHGYRYELRTIQHTVIAKG